MRRVFLCRWWWCRWRCRKQLAQPAADGTSRIGLWRHQVALPLRQITWTAQPFEQSQPLAVGLRQTSGRSGCPTSQRLRFPRSSTPVGAEHLSGRSQRRPHPHREHLRHATAAGSYGVRKQQPGRKRLRQPPSAPYGRYDGRGSTRARQFAPDVFGG